MSDAADLARNAARELQEHGHCKGALRYEGKMCALGALSKAAVGRAGAMALSGPAESQVYISLTNRAIAKGYDGVVHWNDAPERTAEEVEKAFLQVADELEFAE